MSGASTVKLRFLIANYDRCEAVMEYDMTASIETVRQGLLDKLPDLGVKETVTNVNQLRMFEGGKMLVDGKSLADSNVRVYEDNPTAITVSIRPANVPPSISSGKNGSSQGGCCVVV